MISADTKEKLGSINFDSIRFEEEGNGGIVVVFTDAAEKGKLEELALSAYSITEDSEENREIYLQKLLEAIVDEAVRNIDV